VNLNFFYKTKGLIQIPTPIQLALFLTLNVISDILSRGSGGSISANLTSPLLD
jgi:hypothetical protein